MKTKTVSRDSAFYRYFLKWYIWLWNPHSMKLTNCRIGWGILFFPLAFVSVKKKVLRFIPRLSFVAAAVAVVLAANGLKESAGHFVLAAVFDIPFISYLLDSWLGRDIKKYMERKRAEAAAGEEDFPKLEAALNRFAESRIGDAILNFAFGILFRIADLKESKCIVVRVQE